MLTAKLTIMTKLTMLTNADNFGKKYTSMDVPAAFDNGFLRCDPGLCTRRNRQSTAAPVYVSK